MRIVKLSESSELNESSKFRNFDQNDSYGYGCSSELPSGKKTQIFESDEEDLVVLVFFEGMEGDAKGYHVEVTIDPDGSGDDMSVFLKDLTDEKSAIAEGKKVLAAYDKSGISSVQSYVSKGYHRVLG